MHTLRYDGGFYYWRKIDDQYHLRHKQWNKRDELVGIYTHSRTARAAAKNLVRNLNDRD